MPSLSIKPGIMALDASKAALLVFACLEQRFLKGPNDDGQTDLKLDVLAGNLNMSRSDLHDALRELVKADLLSLDVSNIENEGMLRITALRLSAQSLQMPSEDDGPDDNQLELFSAGEANRRRCGSEEDAWDGDKHVAEVKASGEAFSLTVTRFDGKGDSQVVVYTNDYLTPEEAWNAWDSYRERAKPEAAAV